MDENAETEVEEKNDIGKKISEGFNNTTAGISNFISNIGKNKKEDP